MAGLTSATKRLLESNVVLYGGPVVGCRQCTLYNISNLLSLSVSLSCLCKLLPVKLMWLDLRYGSLSVDGQLLL